MSENSKIRIIEIELFCAFRGLGFVIDHVLVGNGRRMLMINECDM